MRTSLASIAALVLLIFSAAGCDKSPSPDASKVADKKEAAGDARNKPVKLAPPQREFLTIEAVTPSNAVEMLALPGRVAFRPQAQSAIGAPTAGRVAQLLARAGEIVKAGAPLLVIDSADASAARATLDQSAIRVTSAENAYRRQAEMIEKGVGLEIERQEAEARLKEARAEHERARNAASLIGAGQGNRVTVRAPADGVVVAIRATVGAVVAPGGEALIELGDPSQLLVVAQVAESDLARVHTGQSADVELPALDGKVAAHVESFSPRVETDSRRALVYLRLEERLPGLRPGMLAQVVLRADAREDAGIVLPLSAVLIKDGKRRVVYVEKPDGSFEARDVQLGRVLEGRATILQGLSVGDRVVVRGGLLLDTQAELLL